MYNILSKKGQLFAVVLGVVGLLLFIIPVLSGLEGFNLLSEEEKVNSNIFNTGILIPIVFIIIAAIAWLLFSVYQMATNPGQAKKGLLGLAGLVAIFLITYFTSEPETSGPIKAAAEEFALNDGASKFVSGAIKTTAVLGGIAILALIAAEVKNFFK